MSNRIRGIRQPIPAGTILARTGIGSGPPRATKIGQVLQGAGAAGAAFVRANQTDTTIAGIPVTATAPTDGQALRYVLASTDLEWYTPAAAPPNYVEGTFTPTVTLVGGAGNTVPVYVTNSGIYTRIGNRVFVDVALLSDGGAEGAGTGQINIALPIASAAAIPSFGIPTSYGTGFNNATAYDLLGYIGPSVSLFPLSYWSAIGTYSDFTGALQNNSTRAIRLKFSYQV